MFRIHGGLHEQLRDAVELMADQRLRLAAEPDVEYPRGRVDGTGEMAHRHAVQYFKLVGRLAEDIEGRTNALSGRDRLKEFRQELKQL